MTAHNEIAQRQAWERLRILARKCRDYVQHLAVSQSGVRSPEGNEENDFKTALDSYLDLVPDETQRQVAQRLVDDFWA